MTSHPSYRALFLTWAVLIALTGASMLAGRVDGDAALAPLGIGGVGFVLLMAGLKCRWILMDFLNLRAADGGWRAGFWAYLIVVGLLILGAYAVAWSGVLPLPR